MEGRFFNVYCGPVEIKIKIKVKDPGQIIQKTEEAEMELHNTTHWRQSCIVQHNEANITSKFQHANQVN